MTAAHPQIIDSELLGKPKALFIAFGDSASLFELRCYIWNIGDKLSVTSDPNFAIDEAFRENDIEIPFPKRDLYVHGLPEGLSITGRSQDQWSEKRTELHGGRLRCQVPKA